MNDLVVQYYSKPQYGDGLPYFEGQRYHQIGGGFLANIGKFLLPILKTLGKHALGIGVETAHRVISKDEPVAEAIQKSVIKRVTGRKRKNSRVNDIIKNKKKKYINKRRRL